MESTEVKSHVETIDPKTNNSISEISSESHIEIANETQEIVAVTIKEEHEHLGSNDSKSESEDASNDGETEINPYNFVVVKTEVQREDGNESEESLVESDISKSPSNETLQENSSGSHEVSNQPAVEISENVSNNSSKPRNYSCSVCGKAFIKKSNVSRHMSVHTGIRPYTCEVCKKAFAQKGDLNAHLRIHSGERPFSCEECKKAFVTKKELNTHSRVHTGIRPYSCPICNSNFSRRAHLNKHVRVHTGDRPYSCEICNKSFSAKSNLNRHNLLHTGNRSFSCDICQKSFLTNGDLDRHSRMHTGFHPFVCPICKKSFSRKDNLSKHFRAHIRKSQNQSSCRSLISIPANLPTNITEDGLVTESESDIDDVPFSCENINEEETNINIKNSDSQRNSDKGVKKEEENVN